MTILKAGERTLTIDGTSYTLRADFRALFAIEAHFEGKKILAIVQEELPQGGAGDFAATLRELLKSGKHEMSLEDAGNLMVAGGFTDVAETVAEVLSATLSPETGSKKKPRRRRAAT